jgi:hypothetical protein
MGLLEVIAAGRESGQRGLTQEAEELRPRAPTPHACRPRRVPKSGPRRLCPRRMRATGRPAVPAPSRLPHGIRSGQVPGNGYNRLPSRSVSVREGRRRSRLTI